MTKQQMIDGLQSALNLMHRDAQFRIDRAENDREAEKVNELYMDAEFFIYRAIAHFIDNTGEIK